MLAALLIASGLLAAEPDRPSPEDWEAYRQARASAGRDAAAHVRLALWCERHGLAARRLEHLALALMADPQDAAARGLMGFVRHADSWLRPDEVAGRVRSDADRSAALAEYNARRAQAAATAQQQYELALWCESNGLEPEARAHLTTVVRLDPSRGDAWRRLGCRRYKGRWLSDEQIRASQAEAQAQARADRAWVPRLSQLRGRLRSPEAERREQAERDLAEVTDPRAVPAIWRVFVAGKERDPARAAQLLSQIDSRAASAALAALAVYGPTAEVRRAAGESLVYRDPREFLEPLILQVHRPLTYEIRPVAGPGSTGELVIEGVRYNLRRTYQAPGVPGNPADFLDPSRATIADPQLRRGLMRRQFGPPPTPGEVEVQAAFQQAALDPSNALARLGTAIPQGTPAVNPTSPAGLALATEFAQADADERAVRRLEETLARNAQELRKGVAAAEQQMRDDLAQVERINDAYRQLNARVLPLLRTITGEDLGEDPEAWASWWSDQEGYVYQSSSNRPTYVEVIPPAYTPELTRLSHSCFAAGTPVRTLDGPRPIESIRVGDRVLTQDVRTGTLAFEPVVAAFHNAPNGTFRVDLGGEAVVATGIHRFWRVGRGWTMARDLKPGDEVRTVGGVARVAAVEADRVQPVFNLEVGGGHSFFVGQAGYLVHDNSLTEPIERPFDAAPALTASTE